MEKTPGAILAALYAFPPNSRGYCGEKSFQPILKRYLAGESGEGIEKALEQEIKSFDTHYAYLRLISRENDLDPFDPKVVRAFWIGNHYLDNVSSDAIRSFIKRDLFKGRKKSKRRMRELCDNLPEGILPHHSFNALYINFVTDKVEKKVANYDQCCVTFGRVVLPSDFSPMISRYSISIAKSNNHLVLRQNTQRIPLEKDGVRLIRDRPKYGDMVSIHWNQVVQKLGNHDLHYLLRYTRSNMEAVNRMISQKK